ncbi:MAG: hypothetical protein IVW57_09955 [Ktedonobacterales bacterium]|nr:hypothetical protein [Ktedonobacterales bacterium]
MFERQRPTQIPTTPVWHLQTEWHWIARAKWLSAALALAALLFAGCGVASTPAGPTVKPCPGPQETPVLATPALILTANTPNRTGGAQVGELVVVEVASTTKWTLTTSSSSLSNLTPQAEQGVFDTQHHLCVWSWRARSAGTAIISLTGTALCEPEKACPAYAALMTFTVNVS